LTVTFTGGQTENITLAAPLLGGDYLSLRLDGAGGSEVMVNGIVSAGGTDNGSQINGGEQDLYGFASGDTVFAGSQVVEPGGTASATTISSGGTEIVSGGGTDVSAQVTGGTEIVLSGGASGVVFSSGGTLQLDAGSHLNGTISGFHLGEEIDLRGLAFNSSSSTLTWKQTTSGANASGTLTVKEGTSSTALTLVGSYTLSNFHATSDGHGGTLITDPCLSG
jgi:autotransporter passenger strand-loop-strand repeat protein